MPLIVRVAGYSGDEPLHPARLHAALRSASCVTEHDRLLRWWEQLPPPEIYRAPPREAPNAGEIVLVWTDADLSSEQLASVRDLVRRVPDESSPWSRLSVEDSVPGGTWHRYVPDDISGEIKLCVASPGFTDALEAGREQRQEWDQLAAVQTYRLDAEQVLSGHGEMLCFRFPRGVAVNGVECGRAATRLQDAVLARVPDPVPPELSGHGANGKPHAAYVPLLDAGPRRARGELLGMAVVFPRRAGEWVEAVRTALLEDSPPLWLPIGPVRTDLVPVDVDDVVPHLHPEYWVGPARVWTSVTPMVLDRFSGKGKESGEIARACRMLGLPEPIKVEVARDSWVRGGANLRPGDLPRRDKRPYTHVRLQFPVPVTGPVLLGAQRHVGMGLCQPEPE